MKSTQIQITVRGVDPLLKRRIVKLAKLKSMSINDFVLETLRSKVGTPPPDVGISWQQHRGVIGEQGINQAVLDDFESVDPTMWDSPR